MKKDAFTFNGFEPANTTPVPDVLFDELLPYLTEAELKVLLYIIRRTWGFKKVTDAISLNQFQKGITTREGKVLDRGCGIKDRKTIINALASLEMKGCICGTKSDDPKGDKATTLYHIHFKEVVGISNHPYIGSGNFQPPVVGISNHGSRQNQPQVVGNSNPQETVQDTVKQQTVSQEREGISASASMPRASLAHDIENVVDEEDDPEATVKAPTPAALKAVPPSQHTSSPAREGKHERNDAAATVQGSEPAASGKNTQERTQDKPKRGRKKPVEEPEPLPAEVVQFLDDWDSLHRAPLPRTDRLIALAKAGVQAAITREELKGCRDWLPTTDRPGKPYYRHKGVGLWDVIDKIGEYRSLQNMPIPGVPLADMKKDPDGPELGIGGLPKFRLDKDKRPRYA